MEEKPTPIIVLGVDRSGTSLIAHLIARWGAFPGDSHLLASGDKHNPRGYWEYEPMESFLGDLFASVKVSHWHPSFPQRLWQRSFVPEIRSRAESLIRDMESAGRPWMWKEPYLSLSLSFWKLLWKDPVYVVVFRDPLESSASYQKLRLPEALQGQLALTGLFLLRWQFFMLSILDHVSTHPRTLFVSYEHLLRNPEEECGRLCRFLDKECRRPSGEAQPGSMAEAVDPALWRNRTGRPFTESPLATQAQKALYESLLRRLDHPCESFDRTLYPIGAEGLEYLENFDLLTAIFKQPLPMAVQPMRPPVSAGGWLAQGA